ncbi:MAG: hypothetical protein Q9217_003670 [Psora testacea]
MARRKTLPPALQQASNLRQDASTATTRELSDREYYNTRYEEVDRNHRSTTLYEVSTDLHIDRQERLWREYCDTVEIDPYHTLTKAMEGRIKNYFHWMCNKYSVKKISSVETYWHQLSQLYIRWKGRRINPLTLKQIYNFINGALAEEHGLDDSETDKPLLDAVDFVALLRCHWVTDTNVFLHERHRVQLPAILIVAGLTGSRPNALLGITYRDLDLFVLVDSTTGEKAFALKTYIFFIDTNPVFCIISHIISLACDDDAYLAPDMTPRKVLTLDVRRGLNCQQILWKEEILGVPVFRASVRTPNGYVISPDRELPYDQYHEWATRLAEETGFVQRFTTYCLRRATGNAINDDPDSNDAVRNLSNSTVFYRNYLSRMIRYDTQAICRGTRPRTQLIHSANRMSRLIDPRRPKDLTEEQSAQIRQEPEIQELRSRRDQLFRRVRDEFKFVYRAKGRPIHEQYVEAKRAVDRRIKERERELKKQIQRDYDATAPVQDILVQLGGDEESVSPVLPPPAPARYAFEERARIAKAFFDPPSTTDAEGDLKWRIWIADDMVSLCSRQEGVFRTARRTRRMRPDNVEADPTLTTVKTEPESESDSPEFVPLLLCQPYQCLYCLGKASLPLDERLRNLSSKYSLERHFDRWHRPFRPGGPCPFPHPDCASITLDSVMLFKNHAARVHGIKMSDKV